VVIWERSLLLVVLSWTNKKATTNTTAEAPTKNEFQKLRNGL